MIGDVFRATSKYLPPPPSGLRSPFEWGTGARLRELFGNRISIMRGERIAFPLRFPSAEFAVDYYRQWYGPTQNAFNNLDESNQRALRDDLIAVYAKHNKA
jgi:hypothetical protein